MSEGKTSAIIKRIGLVVSILVFLVIAYAIARGVLFPVLVVEETVQIPNDTYYSYSYTCNRYANKKLIVEVKSLNGIAVEVAILRGIRAWDSPLNESELRKLDLRDHVSDRRAYSPMLIEGSVRKNAAKDYKYVILIVANNGDAQVKLKVKTLLRF